MNSAPLITNPNYIPNLDSLKAILFLNCIITYIQDTKATFSQPKIYYSLQ